DEQSLCRIELAQLRGFADAGRAQQQDFGAALLLQSFVCADDLHWRTCVSNSRAASLFWSARALTPPAAKAATAFRRSARRCAAPASKLECAPPVMRAISA